MTDLPSAGVRLRFARQSRNVYLTAVAGSTVGAIVGVALLGQHGNVGGVVFLVVVLLLAMGTGWVWRWGTTYRLNGTTLIVSGIQRTSIDLATEGPIEIGTSRRKKVFLYLGTFRVLLGRQQPGETCRFDPDSLRTLADALDRSDRTDAHEAATWLRGFAAEQTYAYWQDVPARM